MANDDEAAPSARTPACPRSSSTRRSASTRLVIKKAIREAVAEATRRGKLRPNSVDSLTGKNSRQQSRHRDARHPLRAVGGGRNRGQADPQGRRLREQEHPVLGALQARPPGPRRPQPGRRAQVHPARGVAGAGPGLRAGRRSASASAATARTATISPRSSSSARSTTSTRTRSWPSWKRRSWRRPTARRRRHGLRRQGLA